MLDALDRYSCSNFASEEKMAMPMFQIQPTLCRAYNGTCTQGGRCWRVHAQEGSAIVSGGDGVGGSGGGMAEPRAKNACRNWLKTGTCSRGETCHFAHEGDGAADSGTGGGGFGSGKTEPRAKKPCRNWLETGKCSRGETCHYAH